jgi:membrane-associated phospholipid phosphatase
MSKNRMLYFHAAWLVFFVPACLCLLFHGKGDFSVWLNGQHSATLDELFATITYFGGFEMVTAIIVTLLLINLRLGLVLFINTAITLLITTALKILFDVDRPVVYFNENMNLHYVEGITMLTEYSFPSGHTSNAFAVYFTLAFYSRRILVKVTLSLLAVFVALSRVYLLQHFLVDVLFGAAIAVLLSHVAILIMKRKTTWLAAYD